MPRGLANTRATGHRTQHQSAVLKTSRTSPGPAGYSGTPLAKKLGMGPASQVCVLHAPANYRELLPTLLALAKWGEKHFPGTKAQHQAPQS